MIVQSLKGLLQGYTHFGVGSLPFKSEADALDFISSRKYLLPFWPELPRKSDQELMMKRAERATSFNWNGYNQEEACGFFSAIKLWKDSKIKIIKGQVVGPVTFSMLNQDIGGNEDFENQFELSCEISIKQSLWQASIIKKEFLGSLIIVLDEPSLIEWPNMSSHRKQVVIDGYSYLYSRLSENGIYVGLHSCGIHYDEFLNFPFDLYSTDCSSRALMKIFDYKNYWNEFFVRGGIFIAGVYCTNPENSEIQFEKEQGDQRLNKINSEFPSFKAQILTSASCGHAFSDLEWMEYLYPKLNL
ncbi:MAG: hypothetical protein SGJ02_14270 [bacterium]|nr:hypothetical protein [bacterium]